MFYSLAVILEYNMSRCNIKRAMCFYCLRYLVTSVLIFFYFSSAYAQKNSNIDTKQHLIDVSNLRYINDTIWVPIEDDDTIPWTRVEFRDIMVKHPELIDDTIEDPDLTYKKGLLSDRNFESETGEDEYFLLYSFFLRRVNKSDTLMQFRENTVAVYHLANAIFQRLSGGGTAYGHLYLRSYAYADYALYAYAHQKNAATLTNDFEKERSEFFLRLERRIQDHLLDNRGSYDDEGFAERNKGINNDLNQLKNLISDSYYLRMAEEFINNHLSFY